MSEDPDQPRPVLARVPDPPPYVPVEPDPVETAHIEQIEARGDLAPGEVIP